MAHWWDAELLNNYIQVDRIPRGLRVLKKCNFLEMDLQQEWNEISLSCSKLWIQIIIKQRKRFLTGIGEKIAQTLKALEKYENIPEFVEWDKKINTLVSNYEKSLLIKKNNKFLRDKTDFDQGQIFHWEKAKSQDMINEEVEPLIGDTLKSHTSWFIQKHYGRSTPKKKKRQKKVKTPSSSPIKQQDKVNTNGSSVRHGVTPLIPPLCANGDCVKETNKGIDEPDANNSWSLEVEKQESGKIKDLGARPKEQKYVRKEKTVKDIEPFLQLAKSPRSKMKRPAVESPEEDEGRVKRCNVREDDRGIISNL